MNQRFISDSPFLKLIQHPAQVPGRGGARIAVAHPRHLARIPAEGASSSDLPTFNRPVC
jgi:hypothetical protein